MFLAGKEPRPNHGNVEFKNHASTRKNDYYYKKKIELKWFHCIKYFIILNIMKWWRLNWQEKESHESMMWLKNKKYNCIFNKCQIENITVCMVRI